MGKLEGRATVITGGASGIGAATARLFVEEGARVVICDIQDAKGQDLADELGERAVYQHADVRQEADVEGVVQRAVKDCGRLDCMFNNAGIGGATGPLEAIPVEEYDLTMNTLLRGVFLGIKHAAPVMKRQGQGSIISTSSVAGLRAGHSPHLYAAAKAAMIQLTRSVAMEMGESGVRVNCICPGGIATPLLLNALGLNEDAMEVLKQGLAQMQPIRRSGLPEDIAQAALWLASDDASFVNGHALVVDGGLTGGTLWSEQPELFRVYQPLTP